LPADPEALLDDRSVPEFIQEDGPWDDPNTFDDTRFGLGAYEDGSLRLVRLGKAGQCPQITTVDAAGAFCTSSMMIGLVNCSGWQASSRSRSSAGRRIRSRAKSVFSRSNEMLSGNFV